MNAFEPDPTKRNHFLWEAVPERVSRGYFCVNKEYGDDDGESDTKGTERERESD